MRIFSSDDEFANKIVIVFDVFTVRDLFLYWKPNKICFLGYLYGNYFQFCGMMVFVVNCRIESTIT